MFYRINDGRVWSIEEAKFVNSFNAEETIALRADGKPGDEAYLKRTLALYGYPIGDELKTDEERAEEARAERNRLISATDFLLMPDYPLEADQLEAVKAYRQALRDVPEQSGFPKTIEWPSKPEVIL